MIHGDCSSRGCYAMTDEQISEIYALARESFFGGQRSFQIQAFPFRMTPLNMAKHRNSPHMAFWKMLKQGYDHFEVTRLEPKVDVCEKRYVFNAEVIEPVQPRRPLPGLQGAGRHRRRRPRQAAPRRHPDRRTDQPRHARGAGQDGHRRRHEPDLPVGGEDPMAAPAPPSAPRRHDPGPRQSAGRASGNRDRQHNEPRFRRIEAGARAAFVGASRLGGSSGGIGGFFGNLFGSKSEDKSPAQWGGKSANPRRRRKRRRRRPSRCRSAAKRPVETKSEPPVGGSTESRPAADSPHATAYAPQPAAPRQEASAEPDNRPAL